MSSATSDQSGPSELGAYLERRLGGRAPSPVLAGLHDQTAGNPLFLEQILARVKMAAEPALLREAGLPGRSWYRHHLYAPGFYTGYGVKTLPAVREPIELRRWEEATAGIAATAAAIASLTEQIDRATAVWSGR